MSAPLRAIKVVHTIIWAFFAGCVIAIPVAAWAGQLDVAFILAAVVLVEVIVLLVNGMSCPLTAVAARHTSDRAPNFDIYLPRWLAQHNKSIFGALYVAGVVYALVCWSVARG